MTSSSNVFGEKASIFVSLIATLIGLTLSITAILLPSWQVVNLREYNSIHEHGLWLDCRRHSRDSNANVLLRRYTTNTEPLNCVYKFDYDKYSGTFDFEDDNSPVGEVNRHKFYGWHTATLILLGLALLTSFLSICLGLSACCYSSLALIVTGVTLMTTFLSVTAEGLFFFYSHRADVRFIKGIVSTYEQRVGLAFFLQMAACACHFLSFLVSLIFVYFAWTGKSDASDRYSFNRESKLNVASMGRSLEFEPQMIYQQNVAPAVIRPPHYMKHQEQYDKNIAGSTPELGTRQLSAEFFGQRVRRKSETCV
uniref:Clc-like protein n=1 Tax=Elaeophora elaphi TaxID=1147741 RepID=A0A0R3RVB0_9BILA